MHPLLRQASRPEGACGLRNEVNKNLNSVEKIRKFLVAEEPFTYENRLLTQTFKVKKDQVYLKFEELINKFYSKL